MAKHYKYENSNMLDIPATAEELGCSVRFVRELIDKGKLKHYRFSRKLIRVSRQAIKDYIASVEMGGLNNEA